MTLKPIADKAVEQICKTVSASISDDERKNVSRIVEQAVIDAAISTSQECVSVAKFHAGPEADLAHKIAEQVKLKETALIANLMGLR